MGKKRVHKPDHDSHNEKASREQTRRQRNSPKLDESMRHRSGHSVVEGGANEERGEPSREGYETHKGPVPLINK